MNMQWKRFGLPLAIVSMMAGIMMLLMTSLNAATANPSEIDAPRDWVPQSRNTSDTQQVSYQSDHAIELSEELITESIQRGAAERSVYLVIMQDESLAQYSGGIPGYPGTARQATGEAKIDPRSADSVRYLDYLGSRRTDTIKAANAVIGRDLDILFEYGATIVGFAAKMTEAEADAVAALANIRFVELEKVSELHTDVGPAWSGTTDVWGGDWNALNYQAVLSGSQETTPVTTNVTGNGTFTYNFYTNQLSYTITAQNPDGVSLTAMHIHSGTAGTDGGVIHNFGIAATTGALNETGAVTLTDDQEAALVNKALYINVHSAANPAGEVRGQIELKGTLGAGVVVGIIDTGIDPWNPSFAGVGGDGYIHTNPRGEGTYIGVCDPANAGSGEIVAYDATFPCNSKLIGAWGYSSVDASPRDSNGHGSHTAGTTAGNIVFNANAVAPTEVFTADISGVAPHANIIAYDACCTGSALSAARDQALLDGVDVINYSIGSSAPTGDFWADAEAMQWLALREAGVFVATSNGNAGNGDATTGSPSDLPWITSVGANSHNRSFLVTLMMTDTASATAQVSGAAMTTGYGPAQVILSTHYSNTEDARLCAPGAFAAGTFSGEIVVCERGTYGRVAKGQAVLDGGAGGFILAQPDAATGGPGSVAADTHVLPAAHIDYNQYQILRQFLITDGVGAIMGTLSGASLDVNASHGDIMASFSSRGPNGTNADLIVPSLTAPGRQIWAAYAQGAGGDGDYTYNVIQGTSMASPHVAGAGALLTALHADWTPAEMQSALMMTARDTVLNDDGVNIATPFAQGSGHIQIARAAMSPLVMDITKTQYDEASPSVENNFFVRDLNTASFGEDACVGSCKWTRTVKNVSSETLTWTVSFTSSTDVTPSAGPTTFSLAPGASQELAITIDVLGATIDGAWRFGSLILDESSGNYPDAHLPFAILPSSGNIPETLQINTQTISGSVNMADLVSIDITDFYTEVVGLVKADRHSFTSVLDNDTSVGFPDIFFDNVTTTNFISFEVPANSFSAIAEIVDTTSPDLDMLLFRDVDGDGPELSDAGNPSTNNDTCQSASGGSSEFCEILSPTAGTYYVAIINFSQAEPGGDSVDLATAVLAKGGTDLGNMSVSGPMTVTDNAPYTMTVNYNDATMTAVDKMYGYFTVGSSSATPGNVATVRVFLTYLGVPDISVSPLSLASTQAPNVTVTDTLKITTTGGVLDWTMVTPNGIEAIQDGGFELGYADNPYWRADSLIAGGALPICSAATCFGANLATQGDWFIWFGGIGGQKGHLEQDITIAPGDVANLTFRMLMGTADPLTATMRMTVSIDGTPVHVYTEADLAAYGSYPTASIDVSAYADGGTHLLRFDFENSPVYNFNVFIDEMSLSSIAAEALTCNVVGNIPWLSASPSAGSLAPGSTDSTISFNSAGLGNGVYTDTLCVNSNDPDEAVIGVSVAMTVVQPIMSITPMSMTHVVNPGDPLSHTLTISNSGNITLTWSTGEANEGPMMHTAVAATNYLTEQFGAVFPSPGWSISDTAGTDSSWVSTTIAYEGDRSAFVPYNSTLPVDTWLVSSPFDTGSSEGLLDFYSATSLTWCRDGVDQCDLDVWVILGDTVGDADDIYLGKADDQWAASWVWSPIRMLIPANLGSVRIAFRVTSADGASIYLDAVNVKQRTSACEHLTDIPWLTISPASGTTGVHMTSDIVVTMDSTTAPRGVSNKSICFFSNDPGNLVTEIPLSFTVMDYIYFPLAPVSGQETGFFNGNE